LDRLNDLQVDFDNYRERTEKEMKETEENSSKRLVTGMLSVLDEMDLAVKHAKDVAGGTELKEGIEMVQKNLYSSLESAGLKKIDPVGKPFDPSQQEAVDKVQGFSSGPDIVVEELRTGYSFRGRVIRPSMVRVVMGSKKQPDKSKAEDEPYQ